MKRILLTIVILFAVAGGLHTFLASQRPAPAREQGLSIAQQYRPAATAEQFDSVRFNQQGLQAWRLQASHVEVYSRPDVSIFTAPVADLFRQGTAQWQAVARQGELRDQQRVHLKQDVVIMSRVPNSRIQRIETDYLELDLDARTADTQQPVRITGPGLAIDANGLHAELDNEVILLTDGVRSVYEP